MKIYFYAKSGHTIGLEATKKCATIINILKNFDPILCTSDFRAGAFAKDNLGVKKYVLCGLGGWPLPTMADGDALHIARTKASSAVGWVRRH